MENPDKHARPIKPIDIPKWANLTDAQEHEYKGLILRARRADRLAYYDVAEQLEEQAKEYAHKCSESNKNENNN